MNKLLIKDNGFECTQCKKIMIDGHKHDNEEDICDTCKIANLEKKLAITETALELACKELIDNACIQCNNCNRYEMCDYVLSLYPTSYFIEEAKEMLENE